MRPSRQTEHPSPSLSSNRSFFPFKQAVIFYLRDELVRLAICVGHQTGELVKIAHQVGGVELERLLFCYYVLRCKAIKRIEEYKGEEQERKSERKESVKYVCVTNSSAASSF
jgi:hypothetical protein